MYDFYQLIGKYLQTYKCTLIITFSFLLIDEALYLFVQRPWAVWAPLKLTITIEIATCIWYNIRTYPLKFVGKLRSNKDWEKDKSI